MKRVKLIPPLPPSTFKKPLLIKVKLSAAKNT